TDGQRLLFVAPHQHLAGAPLDWLQPDAQHAVYVASIDQPTPSDLVDTPVDQVSWREDGQWLGLARRSTDGPLSIRLLNSSSGAGQELLPLALKPGAQYVGSWDLVRARL